MLRREFLEPLRLTVAGTARRLEVPRSRLTALLTARRPISADTALRLQRLFGMDAEFWLRLQLHWDVWQAQQGRRGKAIARVRGFVLDDRAIARVPRYLSKAALARILQADG